MGFDSGATDEIKVFRDEGEEIEIENRNQINEIKSSLITEQQVCYYSPFPQSNTLLDYPSVFISIFKSRSFWFFLFSELLLLLDLLFLLAHFPSLSFSHTP